MTTDNEINDFMLRRKQKFVILKPIYKAFEFHMQFLQVRYLTKYLTIVLTSSLLPILIILQT